MASIRHHKKKDGKYCYMVSLRLVDLPQFCMTFDTLEQAEQWIIDHEADYRHNHRPYIAWRNCCDKKESLEEYLNRYKGLE